MTANTTVLVVIIPLFPDDKLSPQATNTLTLENLRDVFPEELGEVRQIFKIVLYQQYCHNCAGWGAMEGMYIASLLN